MQVKYIQQTNPENLETAINRWLEQNRVIVTDIKFYPTNGNSRYINPSCFILYETVPNYIEEEAFYA